MKNKKLLIIVIIIIVALIIVGGIINYIVKSGKEIKQENKDLGIVNNNANSLQTKNLENDIVKMEISIFDENSTDGITYTKPVEIKDNNKIEDILNIINSASLYPDEEFDRDYGAGDYFESCPKLVLYSSEGENYTILACDNFDENLNIFYISETEDFSEKTLYKTDSSFEKIIKELYNENANINSTIDMTEKNYPTNDDKSFEGDKKDDENTNISSTVQYIDMTERNYPSNDNKSFEWDWKGVKKNQDGTYTIYGRVYEKQDLPQLTAEQYKKLENGQEIKVFDIELEKDDSDIAQNSGYDMLLKDDDEMFFAYVSKNSDGTADLTYYSEFCIGKATDTYLKITVDKNTPYCIGDTIPDSIDAVDTFEYNYNLYMKQNAEYPFDDFNYNEEYRKIVWWGDFIFENGEFKGILLTGI